MDTITISNIQFPEGDPCQPRYTDFYRYPENVPVQIEPAFQIDDGLDELQVRLELDPGSKVQFTLKEGRPLCRLLNSAARDPYLGVEGSSTSCTLTWHRSGADRTQVFRLYCQPESGELTDEQRVHGGLFIAFTTWPTGSMGKEIQPGLTEPTLDNVLLVGSDAEHRPIYDVHHRPRTLPSEVEIEPAFRVREGLPLQFGMTMAIPYAEWKEELLFLQPEIKPESLSSSFSPDKPELYGFTWRQIQPRPCLKPEDCHLGAIVTFHLEPVLPDSIEKFSLEGWTQQDYRDAVEGIGVDPTIIQPPPCDPFYQVCYRDVPPPTRA